LGSPFVFNNSPASFFKNRVVRRPCFFGSFGLNSMQFKKLTGFWRSVTPFHAPAM